MKRLYIAAALLTAVVTLCVVTHLYLHRRIDGMLDTLDRIERMARDGDDRVLGLAEEFAEEYRQVSDLVSCYVAHSELRESRETAALLPTLIREDGEEELYMEIARLRSQLVYLQQVDDPSFQNIL